MWVYCLTEALATIQSYASKFDYGFLVCTFVKFENSKKRSKILSRKKLGNSRLWLCSNCSTWEINVSLSFVFGNVIAQIRHLYFESEKIEDQKSQIPPLDNFRPFLSNSVATEIQVDRRPLFFFLSAALFVFTWQIYLVHLAPRSRRFPPIK